MPQRKVSSPSQRQALAQDALVHGDAAVARRTGFAERTVRGWRQTLGLHKARPAPAAAADLREMTANNEFNGGRPPWDAIYLERNDAAIDSFLEEYGHVNASSTLEAARRWPYVQHASSLLERQHEALREMLAERAPDDMSSRWMIVQDAHGIAHEVKYTGTQWDWDDASCRDALTRFMNEASSPEEVRARCDMVLAVSPPSTAAMRQIGLDPHQRESGRPVYYERWEDGTPRLRPSGDIKRSQPAAMHALNRHGFSLDAVPSSNELSFDEMLALADGIACQRDKLLAARRGLETICTVTYKRGDEVRAIDPSTGMSSPVATVVSGGHAERWHKSTVDEAIIRQSYEMARIHVLDPVQTATQNFLGVYGPRLAYRRRALKDDDGNPMSSICDITGRSLEELSKARRAKLSIRDPSG